MNTVPYSDFAKPTCRRNFLQVGSASLFGLPLAALLDQRAGAATEAPVPPAKNVIMLFLTGGPATIDMWDLKPDAPAGIRGEFVPRETSVPGVRICEHLPRLAEQMQHATLIRSMTHTIAEHTQGVAYVMSGNRPNPGAESPSLGSLSSSLLKADRGTPVYMTIGQVPSGGAGELGPTLAPFEVSVADETAKPRAGGIGLPPGFTAADLERRRRVLERIDGGLRDVESAPLARQLAQFQQEGLEILRSDRINKALRVDDEGNAWQDRYGRGTLGRNALAARRLIEAGSRFVTIGFGDWDTHNNNFTRLRTSLLPELDRALSALLADLHERGRLEETIVYCTGEFGRTPGVNDNAGRDHWARTMTAFVAGGGFRGGFVFGATDAQGVEPTESPCSPDDVSATIFHQLGFAPTHHVQNRNGRPIPLFRNGQVVDALLGKS